MRTIIKPNKKTTLFSGTDNKLELHLKFDNRPIGYTANVSQPAGIIDSSINCEHLGIDAPSVDIQFDKGPCGTSLRFFGTNDYIRRTFNSKVFSLLSNPNLFTNFPLLSFSLWIYPINITGSKTIISTYCFSIDVPTQYTFGLFLTGGNLSIGPRTYTVTGTPTTLIYGPDVEINQWQHIAVVIRSRYSVDFYLNGNKTTGSGDLYQVDWYYQSVQGYEIGATGVSAGTYFLTQAGDYNGYMSDFRLYDRQLTDREVSILYKRPMITKIKV